jgi:SAM-dependent methyltransferase
MRLSRETNLFLNWVLNELVPPWIRDRRWFGWMITKALFKDRAHHFMNFHSRVYQMTDAEYSGVYEATRGVAIERDTDLNDACLERILMHAVGPKVLETGCGGGFLAKKLAERFEVTATDIVVDPALVAANPKITFEKGNVEHLPFPDGAFDTVVTTHVLEHVRDIQAALKELRRVTKRRLIVVVPKERPHFYTPNLHLHFFPYPFSFYGVFGYRPDSLLENAGGDWFYMEEKKAA